VTIGVISSGGGRVGSEKIAYAGVVGAVAGVLAFLGSLSTWWSTETAVYSGTAHVMGDLALWASLATFVFGGAYIVLSDLGLRRAMGALMTISAVVVTIAAMVGAYSGDEVATGTKIEGGLWATALGGVLGVIAGLLALQNSIQSQEVVWVVGPPEETAPPEPAPPQR
jgi:hypothetical protein